MEDDARAFLVLILNTITRVLIWMMSNVFIGIYLGYGFYRESMTWKNMVYYVFLILGFVFLMRWIVKKWRKMV